MREIRLSFLRSEQDAWRRGELQQRWFEEHTGLFDADDLRLALSQTTGHYLEWKAASHFYRAGYRALLEKYELHVAKLEIFMARLGPPADELIDELVKGRGLPDLFVYRPDDEADWFFAEVKRAKEAFGKNQPNAFQAIERRFGTERLVVVRFDEVSERNLG